MESIVSHFWIYLIDRDINAAINILNEGLKIYNAA